MNKSINGKPLEFGNPEQIKFVQQAERNMQELVSDGISVYDYRITVQASVTMDLIFKCFQCGSQITNSQCHPYISGNQTIGELIENEELECKSCRCIYLADNGVITLVENPINPDLITNTEFVL